MDDEKTISRKNKILMGIYASSWRTSMVALAIVAALEVFMLAYTIVDPALFGAYMGEYRAFYISLFTAAVVYILLNIFVKRDMEHRYLLLNVANPVYAVLFFAWSLGITYFDALKFGTVDPTVFMTFSLMVPLSFFLFPAVYTAIVLVADVLILYAAVSVTGSAAPLINISIFCIFQLVLGISFLRLKMRLTERIVEEQENADMDVLSGFPNRRLYEKDMAKLAESPLQDDLVYVSVDLNELKEVNDTYGHEAGDKLIVGVAECIARCFGDKGKAYRIGGDEFVALINVGTDEVEQLLDDFKRSMETWSSENGMTLSAASGYVSHAEFPDKSAVELARMADEKMYAAKVRYYEESGRDRRRYSS